MNRNLIVVRDDLNADRDDGHKQGLKVQNADIQMQPFIEVRRLGKYIRNSPPENQVEIILDCSRKGVQEN